MEICKIKVSAYNYSNPFYLHHIRMTEEDNMIDNRIHMRLKRHFIKHGKKIHAHIKKHHKKYLFWSTAYGISHIIILKVLALKLLIFKWLIAILAFVGITNPSLTDIFAKMDNVCINHKPVIAQQICEKDFDTIQDAIGYLEAMIDPETDNIYNAQYYGIMKSLLGEYCSTKIDQDEINNETKKINDIAKWSNSIQKLHVLKEANTAWKEQSLKNNSTGEVEFCNEKYLAYDMLDLSKKLFIKELKKWGLLNPSPILSWQKTNKKTDSYIINTFGQGSREYTDGIQYTLEELWNGNANTIANIIKNISINASEESLNALYDMNIITQQEKQEIQNKLEIRFVSSCNKNVWYHKIKQYYNSDNILTKTTLEEIKIDIGLCNSYQYIDQLDQQVKKLLVHEIGHYIYYFKDKSTNIFENICRNKKGTTAQNKCNRDEFVSNYSQTNAGEDYAETFSRWTLTEINNKINDIEIEWENWHESAYTSIEKNLLSKKFNYFTDLLTKWNPRAM